MKCNSYLSSSSFQDTEMPLNLNDKFISEQETQTNTQLNS